MFLYIGQLEVPSATHDLVRACLKHYDLTKERGPNKGKFDETPIGIGPYGKPYLIDFPNVHFSVSHTGSYWGCAIEESPIGLDLEDRRGRQTRDSELKQIKRWEKIAMRFFAPEEDEWIKEKGEEAFFQLWVLKEAYAKYKGTGITTELMRIPLVQNGILLDRIDDAYFINLEPSQGLYGALCGVEPIRLENHVDLKQLDF